MSIFHRKSSISLTLLCILFIFLSQVQSLQAGDKTGEMQYKKLSEIIRGSGDLSLIKKLNQEPRKLKWDAAKSMDFTGNIRQLKAENRKGNIDELNIYMLRKLSGEIFILTLPDDRTLLEEGKGTPYSGINKKLQDKLVFKARVQEIKINGETFKIAKLTEPPKQVLLDKIFKICIVLMLFFVMIGMGLTLTLKDFALVFSKPRGIILGQILQFGLMPLLALVMGHLLGYYNTFPFIFVGMILITAIPGGVTSNLMTYYAKGDLALSISLTSFSTVMSLVFTPLLLGLYCANVPDVKIPVKLVVQTITILVIVPLSVGMLVRGKWQKFAEKATPFFSILGVIALLFLIVAGLLSNYEKFAETERYGFKFYTMVFSLTLLGMFFGAIFPKLIKINNYQTRAISLETGLRNASLAMAIALLIQDVMGDFYSSMFFVSGIFGLTMYVAGFISIAVYKKLLPIEEKQEEHADNIVVK